MNRRGILIAITSIFASCLTEKAEAANKQSRLILEQEDGQNLHYDLGMNFTVSQTLTEDEKRRGISPYTIKIENGRVYYLPTKYNPTA